MDIKLSKKQKKKLKKEKKQLKLQARLLDLLLDVEENAMRTDELHNIRRMIRSYRKSVSFSGKKIRQYFWNDLCDGVFVMLNCARRDDEVDNLTEILTIMKTLRKL